MRVAVLLTTVSLMACAGTEVVQEQLEKEVIQMPGSLEGLPFSSAVRVGDMLYLSGQIGTLPGTRDLAPGGVAAEARQTLENIKEVLVKCTVFLLDINDYAAVNEVYATYFPENPPARSALAATGLALGSQVEIECFALAGR